MTASPFESAATDCRGQFRTAPFSEQAVAITGGTSGIGLESARVLAATVRERAPAAEVVFLAADVAHPEAG